MLVEDGPFVVAVQSRREYLYCGLRSAFRELIEEERQQPLVVHPAIHGVVANPVDHLLGVCLVVVWCGLHARLGRAGRVVVGFVPVCYDDGLAVAAAV